MTKTAALASAILILLFAVLASQAASAAPDVADFLREADIRDMELSPDGTHLAMVVNQGTTRSVVVRDITKPGMPIIGVYGDDLIRPNYLYWGNNERLLVVLSVPADLARATREKKRFKDFDIYDYFMISRVTAIDRDMKNPVVLMEGERALHHNLSLSRITNFLLNDDDHVLIDAYRSGRRVQFRVNINTGDAQEVTSGPDRTFRFFNDDDGNPRFRFDFVARSRVIVVYEYRDGGGWKKVEKIYLDTDDEDSLATAGLIALQGSDLVFRRRNEGTGYFELLILDSETGERRPLASLPDRDVGGAVFARRTDQIIGYTVEEDYVRHVYFDKEIQADYDAIAAQVGDYNFDVSSASDARNLSLVRTWGPDDPTSYHLWNAGTETLSFLADAYQKLADAGLSAPAMATYKARDGQPIRAYILFPAAYESGRAHPTVVLPHGGPQSRSRYSYNELAQFLSTRGYVVIQPNFRGSVGYGRDFEEAGYREWGGVMQDDVTDAVTFLTERGIADPDRVCIVGASYGGYAALMGVVKTPSLYRCAISLNGVTHLENQVRHDMQYVDKDDWQKILYDRIGHPRDDKALLDRNSPALRADEIKAPVLLVAGTRDPIVPYSQSRMMRKALEKAGVPHEFIELEDTGHNPIYYREDREEVFPAIEAFLKKHLQ